MVKEKINPFFEVLITGGDTLIIKNRLLDKILFRCAITNSFNEDSKKILFNKLEILFHQKLTVSDTEYKFLNQLKKNIHEISQAERNAVDFSVHLFIWLQDTQLERVSISGKSISRQTVLKNKFGKKEAIVILDSIKEDNLIEIVDYLRTYDYLYFVQTGVINSVGPFIKKSHLLEYNLKEILFNTDIETVFTESALLNINSFREELIAGMIIERISNYLLSLSPLHNRKLILNKDSNVVLSEELPLV